jgi:hypothetical protein
LRILKGCENAHLASLQDAIGNRSLPGVSRRALNPWLPSVAPTILPNGTPVILADESRWQGGVKEVTRG